MKKAKHERKKFKIIEAYSVLLFIATLFMCIGYAEISGITLKIVGTIQGSMPRVVFITEVISEDETNAVVNNYTSTTMDTTITLASETDTKKFTVTIHNNTRTEQVFIDVIKIDGMEGYNNENIEYVLTDNMIPKETILQPDSSITFDVTLSYNPPETPEESETPELPEIVLKSILNFRFKEVPKIKLTGNDSIEDIYPGYTPQEYIFIVENFEETGYNGVPLSYTLAAEIQKPFVAKIYNENDEEVQSTTPIQMRGDKIEETHTYKLKIIWDNSNPEDGIDYNYADYADKSYNCKISLVATPDIIDEEDKYRGYTISKEKNIEVTTKPIYFAVDVENEIIEIANNEVQTTMTIKNNDGEPNTQNYNDHEIKYKISMDNSDYVLKIDGIEEVGNTEYILGANQVANIQHTVRLERQISTAMPSTEVCNVTIEAIGQYNIVKTIKFRIKNPGVWIASNDPADSELEIITDYGLIDVIWLSEDTNVVTQTANAPDLYTNLEESKRLTPVSWTYYEEGIIENEKTVNWQLDTTPKEKWYDYSAESGNDGKVDNTTSMWANAINTDGSYFVWIPRYAYRITYYSDAAYTDVTGYYDGYGMWREDDARKKFDLDEGIETVLHNNKKYIVHPAFMDDTGKVDSSGNALPDFDRGGWDKNLTGIWVSKYEASRTGATATDGGSGYSTTFKSVPGVMSAGTIAVGNMYQVGKSYDSDKESHLLKNSEWGAVTYLTQSQYGRNGYQIAINNSPLTGNGGGSPAAENTDATYEYNTILGAKASSTGNIYGVYDLSGGAWEHVAGYNKLGQSSRLTSTNYGGNMTKETKDAETGAYISTKYATAYSNAGTNNTDLVALYSVGKVGDATKEAVITSGGAYWHNDALRIIIYGAPFYGRGGSYGYGDAGGIFYSDSTNGYRYASVGFRMSLGK